MSKIIGAFVFKADGNGCLTAKWLNNDEHTAYPEACKLKSEKENMYTDKFSGIYKTTWIQQGDKVEHTDLKIIQTIPGIYILEWINASGTVVFEGTGMIYENLLIGSYWQ